MSYSEMKIIVNAQSLLKKLTENLENHKKMYKESLDGFKEFARKVLESKLDELSRGEINTLNVNFSPPTDHSKDYERAIGMMEWHEDEDIEMTCEDYATLINDEWSWIGAWLNSNKRFSKSVTEYASGKGI